MSTAGAAAGAAAASAAATALMNAVSAAGGMVRVEPEDFLRLLATHEPEVMVHYLGGWSLFTSTAHNYIMPYKGLMIVTKSTDELLLPKSIEVFEAKSLYLPI